MNQAGSIEIINQWFKNNHDKNVKGFHGKDQLFQSNYDKYIIASREKGRKQQEWTDGMYHQRNRYYKRFSQSFQSLSRVWLFVTPWTAASRASLSIINPHSLPKTMSIDSVMPSNNLILWHPLLLLPSIFPNSRSFPMSQLFPSGGQSIGVSASTSVLPVNTQDWSPLGWTNWISLQSKGLSRVFSNTTVQKHQFFHAQLSL